MEKGGASNIFVIVLTTHELNVLNERSKNEQRSSILLSSIILLLILFPLKASAHEVGIEQTANTDLLYENKEITDFNVLCHNAKNNIDVIDSSRLKTDLLNDIQTKATIKPVDNQADHAVSSSEISIPTYQTTQHLKTLKQGNGEIIEEYVTTVFAADNVAETASVIYDSPWTSKKDWSGAVTGYAKIFYYTNGSYVKAHKFRGTWQKNSNSVTIPQRYIYFRNQGFGYSDAQYQNITLGPYYAASGSYTLDRDAPSNFKALRTNMAYEVVCTSICKIQSVYNASSTWNLSVTVGIGDYPSL